MTRTSSDLTSSPSTASKIRLRLSVIVPAYNEEATIVELLESVGRQSIPGVELETVVIDDCSTDGTRQILEQRPELYSRFITLPRNRGKGGAVKAGLEAATGDYVIFQDADLEYDPSEYGSVLMPVLKHDADVVMGSRLMAPPYTRVHYFWHKLGNRVISLAFNVINNTTYTDVYSCYLLYRRNLLDPSELTTLGWEQQAEILTIVSARGRVLYEVPISYHGRTYEEGKKIRAVHAIRVLWTILVKGIRWRH
jgi:glycosyltransferase involved in cell wall biosynthesis